MLKQYRNNNSTKLREKKLYQKTEIQFKNHFFQLNLFVFYKINNKSLLNLNFLNRKKFINKFFEGHKKNKRTGDRYMNKLLTISKIKTDQIQKIKI